MRTCIKCGNEVQAVWRYCPVCGGSEFREEAPPVLEADDYERYATVSPLPAGVREAYVRSRFPREASAGEPPRLSFSEGPGPEERQGYRPEETPGKLPEGREKDRYGGLRGGLETDRLVLKPAGKAFTVLGSLLVLGLGILGFLALGDGLVEVLDDVFYSYSGDSGLGQFRTVLAMVGNWMLLSVVFGVGAGGFLGLCFAYLRIRRVPVISQVLAAGMSFVRWLPGEFWIVTAYYRYGRENEGMIYIGVFIMLGSAYLGSLAHRRITEGISEGKWETPASFGGFRALLKGGGLRGAGREIRLLAHCAAAYAVWWDLAAFGAVGSRFTSYGMLLILLFTVPDGLVSMLVRGIRKKKSAGRGGV